MANVNERSDWDEDWSALSTPATEEDKSWLMGGEVDGHLPDSVRHDVNGISQFNSCIAVFEQFAENSSTNYEEEIASARTASRSFAERICSLLGSIG